MNRPLDVLFVNADSSAQAYQELSKDFSAIEPPTWALLLAQACRANGFGVAILDCGAERLADEEAVEAHCRNKSAVSSVLSSMAKIQIPARRT